jgi:SAM-dependent methyltransferase
VIKEISRVLKPGGHFSISDVVLIGELPDKLKHAAEMYAGCVSGAIQKNDYLALISKNGFKEVVVQKQKEIVLPGDILSGYMTPEEIKTFRESKVGIYSVTVFGQKPEAACCAPGCCN